MPVKNTNPRKTKEKGEEVSARDKLLGKSGKKEQSTGKKKETREVIAVEDPTVAEAIDILTTCAHVEKAIKGHKDASRGIVMPWGRKRTLLGWLRQGSKAENIKLTTPNGSSFILQVKDTLTGARGFRVPKGEDNEPIDVKKHLQNHGVLDSLISRIMDGGEFVDEQIMTIPMAKLEKENKPLADRLIDLIVAANEGGVTAKNGKAIKFTDGEVGQLVESVHDVTIKEGFLQRIVAHVKAVAKDEEEQLVLLDKILDAVPPQWAVGSATPGLNEEDVLRRLLGATEMEDEEETPKVPLKPVDHEVDKYIFRVTGLNIAIIRKSDNKELATKKCQDRPHVTNTINKWQKEPNSLAAYIAEHV